VDPEDPDEPEVLEELDGLDGLELDPVELEDDELGELEELVVLVELWVAACATSATPTTSPPDTAKATSACLIRGDMFHLLPMSVSCSHHATRPFARPVSRLTAHQEFFRT
jgi:hypothetical protein